MIALKFTHTCEDEIEAKAMVRGWIHQTGSIAAKARPPTSDVEHWVVDCYQVDEPTMNERELRSMGFTRVVIPLANYAELGIKVS